MKIRYTFPVDTELIGRAKGLVAGSKGRLSVAGLIAMGLVHIVRRLERSGANTTYRGRRIRLRAGRRRKGDTMRWARHERMKDD
jgi:hypothetical protein